MNIAELFARIGLKTDEHKAKSFHRAMTTVKVGMFAATAAAAATSLAIRKITSDAMAGAVAFKQFEVETGASAQQLQKWQSVAEQTNQSAESVSSAIKAIVSNQEKIRLGQGDISGYQLLGIDPRQDPFKILEDLREKSKGLSDGMKKNILSQIGVGTGLLQTLNLTRDEFDSMADRAWIISPQAIETLNKTKSSVDLASRAIKYMKTQIAVGLSPEIRKTTKDIQEFLKANEKGIIKGFKLGYKYVSMFVGAITNAASMINSLVRSTVGWEAAIKGLLGVIILMNSALLISPIGLIAAGFILLVAVLDDLYVYSKGGKSLFGEFMKSFPELEKSLKGFFSSLKEAYNLYKAFSSSDEMSIKNILKEWGDLGKSILFVYEKLKAIGDFTKNNNIKTPGILDFVPGGRFAEIGLKSGVDSGIIKEIRGMFSGIGLKSSSDTNIVKAISDMFSKITSKGVTQNNNIDVNISGSGDPVSTGEAAANSIQRSINAASAQLPRDQ